MNNLLGNPWNPSYIVEFKTSFNDEMSFLERFYNGIVSLGSVLMSEYYIANKYQSIMDTYFNYTGWEGRPPLRHLMTDKALLLVNSHYSLNYPYPVAPNFVEVGGVHIRPTKPLPKVINHLVTLFSEPAIKNRNFTQSQLSVGIIIIPFS